MHPTYDGRTGLANRDRYVSVRIIPCRAAHAARQMAVKGTVQLRAFQPECPDCVGPAWAYRHATYYLFPSPDLAPIPEPTTLLLFGATAAGLGLLVRRGRAGTRH